MPKSLNCLAPGDWRKGFEKTLENYTDLELIGKTPREDLPLIVGALKGNQGGSFRSKLEGKCSDNEILIDSAITGRTIKVKVVDEEEDIDKIKGRMK